MKKIIALTIVFICLFTAFSQAQVKRIQSKSLLPGKGSTFSRNLLMNQKMKMSGTLRPANSVKLFKFPQRNASALSVTGIAGNAKNFNQTSAQAVAAKNKTYPDGSTAHYSIVRKTDADANGGSLQIITLGKDNTKQGGTPDTNPNDVKGGTKVCSFITKNYTVTSMDQGLLTPGALGNISVGGVYSLSDMQKGNYKPIVNNRGPVILQMTEKTTDPIVVQNPTIANLNHEVEVLRSQPFPYQPQGFGQLLSSSLVTSASDFDLSIGASYSGWGISLSDQFKYNKSNNKTTFLLDYSNPVYSINATPGDADNSFFFNKGDARNEDPSLVYVDKITYGVRLLVYFESDQSASVISNSFSGSYAGAKLSVDASSKENFSNTDFKIYLYGNRSPISISVRGADALIQTANDLITKIVSQTPYVPSVLGQPISYSMRFVNDNSIAATTCSVLNSPITVCNDNPNGPQNLQVWLSDARRWSDLNPKGFIDIEVLDRNGNTITNQTLFDGRFTDEEANRVDKNIENNSADYAATPYRINFDNISKEDREGGTLRIWSHLVVDGHRDHCFCPNESMASAPNNAAANTAHHLQASYIDIPLKQVEIPEINSSGTASPFKKTLSFNGDYTPGLNAKHGHLLLGFAARFITTTGN
jgi:hypothetical protein